jgi:hypothetical protein
MGVRRLLCGGCGERRAKGRGSTRPLPGPQGHSFGPRASLSCDLGSARVGTHALGSCREAIEARAEGVLAPEIVGRL